MLSLDERKAWLQAELRARISAYMEYHDADPTFDSVISAANNIYVKGQGVELACALALSRERGMLALRIRVTRLNGRAFTITWRRHYSRLLTPLLRANAELLEMEQEQVA